MTEEKRIILNGESHIVVISDEPEALLAAKAAGRAVVAVDASLGTAAMAGSKDIPGLPGDALRGVSYAVPDFADATEELADLVLRRHLGLPWQIGETGQDNLPRGRSELVALGRRVRGIQ